MISIHKSGSSTGDGEAIPAAVGAALLANQSHLNGADVSGGPKGLVRDGSPACAASQKGGVEICCVPSFQGSGQRQQPLLWPPPPPPPSFAPECLHERSHVRIITPSAPASGEALRHVSALKGLSYTTAPSETGRPADRAITLSLCPLSSGSQWRPTLTSLAHTRTHALFAARQRLDSRFGICERKRACVHPSISPAHFSDDAAAAAVYPTCYISKRTRGRCAFFKKKKKNSAWLIEVLCFLPTTFNSLKESRLKSCYRCNQTNCRKRSPPLTNPLALT